MATTIVTPTRTIVTTNTAICGCSVEQTELISRAECFLRLEEQSENQMLLLAKRREEEQDKIFKTLCAASEFTSAKLSETWKLYDTATLAIETEAAVVTKFQALVSERITTFSQANPEAFRSALEQRRKLLGEQLSREQQDTLVYEKRIALVDRRLGELVSQVAVPSAEAQAQTQAETKQQHHQTAHERHGAKKA